MIIDYSINQMVLNTVNFCCGIGGQDLGLEESSHEYKGIKGRFHTVAGYDNDSIACKNFERITGSRAICADLFDSELYTLFHGREPDAGWEELTPEKIRSQCNGVYPDMVFMSPPCKGFSRLLPKKTAKLPKYQALNRLPERILDLTLQAWFDNLPAIILMENVPGIRDKGRGQETLKKIKSKLATMGYVFYEDLYDCGEWGGLGQHRVRYLLIARLPSKIPSFIFQPPKLPLKSIGEILGPLPMPGDTEKCGRLHRIQKLAWRTWERLALIPAGKDWRALENFDRKQWGGAWKIVPWDETSNTVTAATKGVGQSTGVSSVADPRLEFVQGYGNKYKIVECDKPSPAVTGSRVGSGAVLYADPKVPKFNVNRQKVTEWDEAANAVVANAETFVSDPRFNHPTWRRTSVGKVLEWDKPSGAVISSVNLHGAGSGIVADPRLNERDARYPGTYRVIPWNEASNTVTGQTDIQSGAINVADPRISEKWSGAGNYGIMEWDEPAKTITASGDVHSGTAAVADPRIPDPDQRGVFIIIAADGTWHRPITTFEGAMLQGFPPILRDGEYFDIIGCSDGKAREYIGNAVPVQTATAIGNALLATAMPNLIGDWHWGFSDDLIWVQPEAAAEDRQKPLTV